MNVDNRFRDIFDKNTSVMLIINPLDGKILEANQSASNFYGYPLQELIGKYISDINILSPTEITFEMNLAVTEKRNHFNFQHRLSSGIIKHVEVHSSPIRLDGESLLFSIIHDITDRKLAEEKVSALLIEKEILLKEVHHRIKNNLSVMQSLLDLQMSSLQDPSAISAIKDACNRIQSMALLYDKLYLSNDYDYIPLKSYLPSLILDMKCNFPNHSLVEADVQIDDCLLETSRIKYLGIILTEIITNIMKYAFPQGKKGKISIIGKLEGRNLKLKIEDNGEAMPKSVNFENPKTFGLQLIQFLSKQIGATIQLEREENTKITLIFETLQLPKGV
ncbi:MAG: PAS domain S-box protein [Leptospira sp.]|nr:PAS domain S-box protein [Leptospira sp.]